MIVHPQLSFIFGTSCILTVLAVLRTRRNTFQKRNNARIEPQALVSDERFDTVEEGVTAVRKITPKSLGTEREEDVLLRGYEEESILHRHHNNSHNEIQNESQIQETSAQKPSKLMVVHLLAQEAKPFIGYELLQAILSAGLRYGEMNIFHRYKQGYTKNEIIFSLASAQEPGTFDINQMGGFSCRGLCLFMHCHNDEQDILNFNMMLSAAQQLAHELSADLADEQRQSLTNETIARMREELKAEPVMQ